MIAIESGLHYSPRFGRAGRVGGAVRGDGGGSTRVDLDQDWQFRTDPDQSVKHQGGPRPYRPARNRCSVPHTWNIGQFHDYLGVAWYFRRFARPPVMPGTHVELHFGATFYAARVWLNGVQIGAHEGGFTAYSFDISRQLRDDQLPGGTDR